MRCCGHCGQTRLTRPVLLRQNISYLSGRQERMFCGDLCLRCLLPQWWRYTIPTLLLTWFGVMGMIVGPWYIVLNTTETLTAAAGLLCQIRCRA